MKQPADAEETVYDDLRNMKIEVTADTPAYRAVSGQYEAVGTFRTGALLDIDEEPAGAYLHVRGTDYYLSGADAKDSMRWFRNETNLMPYSLELTTAGHYTIETFKGQVYAEMDTVDTMPVYVLPGEDDPRYGILFQNGIYYIPAAEVAATAETGSPKPAVCQSLPVLMYHFFYSEAEGGSRVDGNYVEVNELDEQLKYISENGFTACSMRELQYWMEQRAQLPSQTIAITIDDADPSVHQYAMPVFMKYGIHATNFVICGWQPAEMPYELWEMRENGMELQSHGFLTHTGGCSGMGHGGLLMCMNHDEGVADTRRSFDYVDGGFVYCYPFGDINENAESIVRDGGAKLAFTTEGGRITQAMDPLALPRVRVTGGNGLKAFAASIG